MGDTIKITVTGLGDDIVIDCLPHLRVEDVDVMLNAVRVRMLDRMGIRYGQRDPLELAIQGQPS